MKTMCDPCFRTLGPFEEKTIGRLLLDTPKYCDFCGKWLTQSEWASSHTLANGTHPTCEDRLDTIYAQYLEIQRVMPGTRLTVELKDGVVCGSLKIPETEKPS